MSADADGVPLGPDPYGISERVFGPLNPELPALIGRIVMLSALLESKLEQFADALGTDPRNSVSGMPASQVVKVIRDRLSAYTRDDTEHAFVAASEAALDSAQAVFEHRNQIVHRVWPIAGLSDWKGWKPRRPTVDHIIGDNADWRAYTRTDLLDLLPEAEHAVQQVQVQMAACSAFPRR